MTENHEKPIPLEGVLTKWIATISTIVLALVTFAGAQSPTPENATLLAPANIAALSGDGKVIATGGFKTVRLWDAATGTKIADLDCQRDEIHHLVFSSDGSLLASSGSAADKIARVFDVRTHKEIVSVEARSMIVLGFGTDNKTLITAGSAITVFNLPQGSVAKSISIPANETSFVLLPEGRSVVSLNKFSGKLTVWDLQTGAPAGKQFTQTASSSPSLGGDMSIVAEEKLAIASFMGGGIFVFDLSSMAFDQMIKPEAGNLQSAAFSGDGREFAFGTWETTEPNFVILANTATHKEQVKIGPFPKEVVFASALLSSDGRQLVAVPNNGVKPVMLWHLKKDRNP